MKYVVEPGIGATYSLSIGHVDIYFLKGKLRPNMTIYDIGANRGKHALFFGKYIGNGGKILSFEPVPSVYQSLVANLKLNKLSQVESFCVAVSDTEGKASFLFSEANCTQGKLAHCEVAFKIDSARTLEVDTITLDGLVARGASAPDLLKIDVEGAALKVLRGASQLLEKKAPEVFIELHGPEEQAGVRDELIGRGYVAETLEGDRVHDPSRSWHSPLWCYKP